MSTNRDDGILDGLRKLQEATKKFDNYAKRYAKKDDANGITFNRFAVSSNMKLLLQFTNSLHLSSITPGLWPKEEFNTFKRRPIYRELMKFQPEKIHELEQKINSSTPLLPQDLIIEWYNIVMAYVTDLKFQPENQIHLNSSSQQDTTLIKMLKDLEILLPRLQESAINQFDQEARDMNNLLNDIKTPKTDIDHMYNDLVKQLLDVTPPKEIKQKGTNDRNLMLKNLLLSNVPEEDMNGNKRNDVNKSYKEKFKNLNDYFTIEAAISGVGERPLNSPLIQIFANFFEVLKANNTIDKITEYQAKYRFPKNASELSKFQASEKVLAVLHGSHSTEMKIKQLKAFVSGDKSILQDSKIKTFFGIEPTLITMVKSLVKNLEVANNNIKLPNLNPPASLMS